MAPRGRGVVVGIVLVLVLTAGCGTETAGAPARSSHAPVPSTPPPTLGPVPWTRLPVTSADVRPPGSLPGAEYAGPFIPPWCPSPELHGEVVLSRHAAGTDGAVSLWATSGSEAAFCAVSSESTAGAVLDREGRVLDVAVQPTGAHPVNPPAGPFPLILRSGSVTGPASPPVMVVRWDGQYCGPPPTRLRVDFAGASVDLVVMGAPPACRGAAAPNGPVVLGFVSDPTQLGQPVPPGRGALSASVEVPAPLVSGAPSFDFRVRLVNSSAHPVTLAPCPGYVMAVAGRAYAAAPNPPGTIVTGQLSETGLLNCGAAPDRLLAHQSIVFAMRFTFAHASLPVDPAAVVPGQTATVTWMIAGVAAATGAAPVS